MATKVYAKSYHATRKPASRAKDLDEYAPSPIRRLLRKGASAKRCRHRTCWVLATGDYVWCWACGAIANRQGVWQKPVGLGGVNPYQEWSRRATSLALRRMAEERKAKR